MSASSNEAAGSGENKGISPEILEQIRQAVLFRGMPREELTDLFSFAQVESRERDEVLFRPGDQADRFYFLLNGRIDLYVESSKHKESTIDLVGAGEAFGVASIFDRGHFQHGAKVIENARFVVVPAEPFLKQLGSNFTLVKSMMASMSAHLRFLVRQVGELKLKTTGQRLGSFLLSLTEVEEGEADVTLPYDKKLLANRLGMKPESLSRALGKLREIGVTGEHDILHISDVDRLREFCQEADGL